MQIIELPNHPHHMQGVAIASLVLNQATFKALVQSGTLSKSEALESLDAAIDMQELMLVAYPANRVAISILKKFRSELKSVQEPRTQSAA